MNLPRIKQSLRNKAFTLTEILVCIGLTTTVATTMYSGISGGFGIVTMARQNLRATQIALEKMETMRMYSWDQINSNGFIPPTFTAPFFPSVTTGSTNDGGLTYYGTTLLTNVNLNTTYTNDMRQVIVSVTWTNSRAVHRRELMTYISQYGMQRYIY
jgi:hypothetical protein